MASETRIVEIMASEDFRKRVASLRDEAGAAGDMSMVVLCNVALTLGDRKALRACAEVLAENEARS